MMMSAEEGREKGLWELTARVAIQQHALSGKDAVGACMQV